MIWLKLYSAVRTAMFWVRDNALWLLLLTLGAGAGAKLLRRKDSQVSTLKDALEVQTAKNEIGTLRAQRDAVLAQEAKASALDAALVSQVEEVDASIARRKRRIAALHDKQRDVTQMSDAEIEEVFRDAGL